MNVIARTREDRMCSGAHDEKEIPRRATVHSGIAFALQTNPLSIARAGLDAELDPLCAADQSLAPAVGADIRGSSGSVAARAGNVELIRPPIWVTWPEPLHSEHCVGPPIEA